MAGMRPIRMLSSVVVVLLLLAAACGGQDASPPETAATTAPAPAAAVDSTPATTPAAENRSRLRSRTFRRPLRRRLRALSQPMRQLLSPLRWSTPRLTRQHRRNRSRRPNRMLWTLRTQVMRPAWALGTWSGVGRESPWSRDMENCPSRCPSGPLVVAFERRSTSRARFGWPLSSVSLDSGLVHFEMESPLGQATWEGQVGDGVIDGEFTQGGWPGSFRLQRADDPASSGRGRLDVPPRGGGCSPTARSFWPAS